MKNDKVRQLLIEATRKVLQKREITAERVLDEISKIAFFDPRRLFDLNGELVAIRDLDDECAAAIAGLDVREIADGAAELKKIKIADKLRATELLGRYLKLFTDKVEHSGSLGVQLITSVPRPQRRPLPK